MKILFAVLLLMLSKLAFADEVSHIKLFEFGYPHECEKTILFDTEAKRREIITKYSLDTDTRWYTGYKYNKWNDMIYDFCYLRKGNWIYAVHIEFKGLKTKETSFNVKNCEPISASSKILQCEP